MSDYLRDLLAKLPSPIREAMEAAGFDDGWKEATAMDYLASDEEDQAGMLEFVTGGGPEFCRQLKLKHEDGTPTADDLGQMIS